MVIGRPEKHASRALSGRLTTVPTSVGSCGQVAGSNVADTAAAVPQGDPTGVGAVLLIGDGSKDGRAAVGETALVVAAGVASPADETRVNPEALHAATKIKETTRKLMPENTRRNRWDTRPFPF